MAILKKIKGSTLMETLVATVLIVVIFMAASMILNTIFSNSIKNNTRDIDTYLNELQYLEENNKLQLPHQEEFGKWHISIVEYKENYKSVIEFEASNPETNKTITIEQNKTE
jgi:predicted PurR-regulated permease PerM